MCKNVLLVTLVVLAYIKTIHADNTITNKTTLRKHKVGKYANLTRKTPNSFSTGFFINSSKNQNVFRYSKIEQQQKQKQDAFGWKNNRVFSTPVLVDKVKSYLDPRKNTSSRATSPTTTTKETKKILDSRTTKRQITKFDLLKFWERDSHLKTSTNFQYTHKSEQTLAPDGLKFWERDPKFEGHRKLEKVANILEHRLRNTKLKHSVRRHILRQKLEAIEKASREKIRKDLYSRARGNVKKPKHVNHIGQEREAQIEFLKLARKYEGGNATNTTVEEERNKWLRTDNKESGNKNSQKDSIELSPYSILSQITLDKFKGLDANITIEVLGRTAGFRDIIIIKASRLAPRKSFRADDKYDDSPPEKKIIFIVHGLSVMGFRSVPCLGTVDGLMDLIKLYFHHLDKFDIFLMPMANPDGVAAAGMKMFWNKNMSPQADCPGVNLDRNFDVAWNLTHSIMSSCSQQYPGTEPFSEHETIAVREVFHKFSHRIIAYFHVHSSTYSKDILKGDAVLYPKGFAEHLTDDDKYIDLKGEIDEMIKNCSFKVYTISVDSLHHWYGKILGSSVDFASAVYGIPFAMEFAMQLYEDDMMEEDPEDRMTASVLSTVWSKVINIVFEFINKHSKTVDIQ